MKTLYTRETAQDSVYNTINIDRGQTVRDFAVNVVNVTLKASGATTKEYDTTSKALQLRLMKSAILIGLNHIAVDEKSFDFHVEEFEYDYIVNHIDNLIDYHSV